LTSDNLEHNKELYAKLNEMSSRLKCTPGQLALAWVQHQGDDVAPIPGTTKKKNLEENVGCFDVKLSKQDLEDIEAVFHSQCAKGGRYTDMSLSTMHLETIPLSEWHGS
jgi:aryl-alcohol dehydrogenase-like predicted oxidoreductase